MSWYKFVVAVEVVCYFIKNEPKQYVKVTI